MSAPQRPSRIEEPLSIRQLEIFSTLIEEGSFTRAARRLELSQPTVSGHIADLEARLGLRLVDRRRHGISITPDGEALLPSARATLASERNVRLLASELHGLVTGHLALGSSTTPAVYLLPPVLAAFQATYPSVRFRMTTAPSVEILDGLLDGGIEVAIVGIQPNEEGITCEPIGRDRMVLIVGPEHAFAGRERVTRKEVLEQPLVLRKPGSGSRQAILDGLGIDHTNSEVRRALEVDGTDGVKSVVRAGLGVSFLSDLSIREDVERRSLVPVEVDGFSVMREFFLVKRTEESESPSCRAFCTIARTMLAGEVERSNAI
ncbi:MAG: LysR family transcriptional regulator [Planctomycetes bacterium]|nr:LysR family transcriptional regulator [Planctomycetota bacterium]